MPGNYVPSDKFSYSRIDVYKGCHMRYKINYVDKVNAFSESIALEVGTAIHETEEAIANSIKDNQKINYVGLKNNIIKKMYQLQAKYPEAYAKLDKSNRNYFQKIIEYLRTGIYRLENYMKNHPELEIYGAEVPFTFNYDGVHSFRGSIDRVFKYKNEDRYIIQDIKTYNLPLEPKKLKVPLQFVIYTLAGKKLFNCTEDQIECQYDLPFCDLIQNAASDYLGKGMVELDELFNSIECKDYTPSPTALCHWCPFCPTNPDTKEPYKYLCPYFSKYQEGVEDSWKHVENKWEGIEKHEDILKLYHAQYNIKI